MPSNGYTVVLVDFSGNHFMPFLGNVEATPPYPFTVPVILYLTATAAGHFGAPANEIISF